MEKHIAVIAGDEIHSVELLPGTTTADLRKKLRLPPSYFLSQRDGLPFSENEQIYGMVREGEKLFASPPANVAG